MPSSTSAAVSASNEASRVRGARGARYAEEDAHRGPISGLWIRSGTRRADAASAVRARRTSASRCCRTSTGLQRIWRRSPAPDRSFRSPTGPVRRGWSCRCRGRCGRQCSRSSQRPWPRRRPPVVGEALTLRPGGHGLHDLAGEGLLRRRALVRQDAHRDDDQDGGDHRNRAAREPALHAPVEERKQERDDQQDRGDPDGAEDHGVGPLEDPQEVEEEVEVPVGPRHEVRRARIGRLGVTRPEQARVTAAAGLGILAGGVVPDERRAR